MSIFLRHFNGFMANLRKGHVNNFDQRPTNKNVQELKWITINDKFYMKNPFLFTFVKTEKKK